MKNILLTMVGGLLICTTVGELTYAGSKPVNMVLRVQVDGPPPCTVTGSDVDFGDVLIRRIDGSQYLQDAGVERHRMFLREPLLDSDIFTDLMIRVEMSPHHRVCAIGTDQIAGGNMLLPAVCTKNDMPFIILMPPRRQERSPRHRYFQAMSYSAPITNPQWRWKAALPVKLQARSAS